MATASTKSPTMLTGKRKREVSSCIPCYTRKQKCDRKYPCDRCSRRRQPELCSYYPTPSPTITDKSRDEVDNMHVGARAAELDWAEQDDEGEQSDLSPTSADSRTSPHKGPVSSSLAEAFGYYGPSEFNTMALVRKLVPEEDSPDASDIALPAEIEAEVRKSLQMMLDRPIIDFLVRYFVAKVNWIDQLLYAPWFLAQYKRWWGLHRISSVAGVEFAILILRVCCYASQFLPSPSYIIDSIKGVPLVDIRRSCEEVINALLPICRRLDSRGSLIRVQHIAFAGLGCIGVGRMHAFWEHVSCATRVAQQIGLHLETNVWPDNMDEVEKEMRRRTFCNLYIWDTCLSKRLNSIPFLPEDGLSDDIMPRMRLVPDIDIPDDAPDVFTERVLRARLARFWRKHHSPQRGSAPEPKYDAVAAEKRYEDFCRVFLPTVPPAFALAQPDRQWDGRLPTLPMQRQLLHMAVFEFLCWNFRPTLLQPPDELGRLPGYKQVLAAHGKKALAIAALSLLESVSAVHALMGGSHTRFSGIIMPIFEGAVPLLCLCADPSFPGGAVGEGGMVSPTTGGRSGSPPRAQPRSLDMTMTRMKTDPLGARLSTVSRAECMRAARGALATLQTLAEVSEMADVGARTLARLIGKVDKPEKPSSSPSGWRGPQACVIVDSSCIGGVGEHDKAGWGGGDVVMQRQQAVVESICPWDNDPGIRDYAGGGGSQADFPFTAADMALGVGGPVGVENWEGVFRDFTGSFGL